MLYWIVRAVFKLVFRAVVGVLGGFEVAGASNVPRSGGVIIAPNHLSHLDPAAVGVALRRPVWFMATDELFDVPVAGRLARILRAFPVHQDSPDLGALRRAERLLRAGEALVVFPEGHESRTGELQPLQPGVLLLAQRTGVPLLPVGIVGSDAIMPAASWRLRRAGRPLRMRFGAPVPVAELVGCARGRAALDAGAERLRDAIAAVLLEMGASPSLAPAVRAAPLAAPTTSREGNPGRAGEV